MRYLIKDSLKRIYRLGAPSAEDPENYWIKHVPPSHDITPCMGLHVR